MILFRTLTVLIAPSLLLTVLAWAAVGKEGKKESDTKVEPPAGKEDTPKKEVTNALGMKFVWIPPGTFLMQVPAKEKDRKTDETQFRVKLTKGYYLGVHLVTQKQWQAVMGKNPSWFSARGDGKKDVVDMNTDDFPVEWVSWGDCQEFVKKLSVKEGKKYRLPTEAEWEYACRAGTTTPFHCGESISTEQANYNGQFFYGDGKKGIFREKPTPVDTFAANAWGLKDMHGNVWQWCADWYEPYPKMDLMDGDSLIEDHVKDRRNEKLEAFRVMRGGSWREGPRFSRAASRERNEPESRFSDLGCRVCFSLE